MAAITFEHKVENMERLIRAKPAGPMADLDASSVWYTIAAIDSKMEEMEVVLLDERLKAI